MLVPTQEAAPTTEYHLPEAPLANPTVQRNILAAVQNYDPSAPGASHLDPHQTTPVANFCAEVESILDGSKPNQGMSILHPTGGGKTVTLAEITRIVCGAEQLEDQEIKAIVLVPSHRILKQTAGDGSSTSAIERFAKLSVGEYSGRSKTTNAQVTVMTYQSLRGAIERGDIEKIDPALIVCDEAHHAIDGEWAEDIKAISKDRLLVGTTASEGYSEKRTIKKLFPTVLDKKTFKEGIEEGILAELQGFMYKGSSRITVSRWSREFSEKDLYDAIANSEDNYLAAKICAGEVAQGRQGIVQCVPGHDRAHAKIMAEVLSHTTVTTPDGERKIKATYVDGEMDPGQLDDILKAYQAGHIDVLTYVGILGEGWDSPETDFAVLLCPAGSHVKTEQAMGRPIRRLRNGHKIATLHQFIYEVVGGGPRQVTYLDVLNQANIKQGQVYGGPLKDRQEHPSNGGNGRSFDAKLFATLTGLGDKIAAIDDTPLSEIRIMHGQELLPKDWPSASRLAEQCGIPISKVNSILQQSKVPYRARQITPEISETYYPPRSLQKLAAHLGIEQRPAGRITTMELVRCYHALRNNPTRITPSLIHEAMQDAGITPTRHLDGERVVLTYPTTEISVPLKAQRSRSVIDNGEDELDKLEQPDDATPADIMEWLTNVLVRSEYLETARRERTRLAQQLLLGAIEYAKDADHTKIQAAQLIADQPLHPTQAMQRTMEQRGISFVHLLAAARHTGRYINSFETSRPNS